MAMTYFFLETVGLVEFVLEVDGDGEAGGAGVLVVVIMPVRMIMIVKETTSEGDVEEAPGHEEPHEEGGDCHQGLPADPLDQRRPWTGWNRVVSNSGC